MGLAKAMPGANWAGVIWSMTELVTAQQSQRAKTDGSHLTYSGEGCILKCSPHHKNKKKAQCQLFSIADIQTTGNQPK
jgi:hypothetical protein